MGVGLLDMSSARPSGLGYPQYAGVGWPQVVVRWMRGMSEKGHSLQIRLVSASRDVRCSPKADIRFQRNICSDGPNSDISTAANSALFDHLVGRDENR
jgi:hypothetical protein